MSPLGVVAGKVALVVGAAGLAGGVAYVATQPDEGSPSEQEVVVGAPDTWIDMPLDGAILEVGPVEVVAHATSRAGVDSMELSVSTDGGPQQQQVIDTDGERLVTGTFTWDPPDAGAYVLTVVGVGNDGVRTSPAAVAVTVEGPRVGTSVPGSSSTSSTSTASTASTSTSSSSTTEAPPTSTHSTARPTTTGCPVVAPTLEQPVDGANTRDRTPTLEWSATCDPGRFLVELTRDANFRRIDLTGDVDGVARSWEVPATDQLTCGATYFWRVTADGQTSAVSMFKVLCLGRTGA